MSDIVKMRTMWRCCCRLVHRDSHYRDSHCRQDIHGGVEWHREFPPIFRPAGPADSALLTLCQVSLSSFGRASQTALRSLPLACSAICRLPRSSSLAGRACFCSSVRPFYHASSRSNSRQSLFLFGLLVMIILFQTETTRSGEPHSMHQRGSSFAGAGTEAIERLRCRMPRRGIQHVSEPLRCPVQSMAVLVIEPFVEQHALDLQQFGEYGVAVHSGAVVPRRWLTLTNNWPPLTSTFPCSRLFRRSAALRHRRGPHLCVQPATLPFRILSCDKLQHVRVDAD
jgi:hypothetical protein